MAKLTTRDHVWSAALELAEERATRGSWSRRFDASDVADELEDPPSNKTIRETLASMAELDHLKRARRQGEYEATEELAELYEVSSTLETVREERDQLRERVQELESEVEAARPASPDEPSENGPEGDHDANGGVDPVDTDPRVQRRRALQLDAAIVDTIETLDLPGSGNVLEARRMLLVEVLRCLRDHNEASRSELLENVVDQKLDRVGYRNEFAAWENLIQPVLEELAEDLRSLESPGKGGHQWRWKARTSA